MPPGPETGFRPGASCVSPTLCTFASGPSAADMNRNEVMTTISRPIKDYWTHDSTDACCLPFGTGPPGAMPAVLLRIVNTDQ